MRNVVVSKQARGTIKYDVCSGMFFCLLCMREGDQNGLEHTNATRLNILGYVCCKMGSLRRSLV